MINYCLDYYRIAGGYLDEGTYIFSTDSERLKTIATMQTDGYTITDVYENEDCYCHARSWNECGCGNFEE